MKKLPIENFSIAYVRKGVETQLHFYKKGKKTFILTPRKVKPLSKTKFKIRADMVDDADTYSFSTSEPVKTTYEMITETFLANLIQQRQNQ